MKQHNTPPAPLTIFVRVLRKDLSRKCSASRMQLDFTTIFLFTNKPRGREINFCRSSHETAQRTPLPLSMFRLVFPKGLANRTKMKGNMIFLSIDKPCVQEMKMKWPWITKKFSFFFLHRSAIQPNAKCRDPGNNTQYCNLYCGEHRESMGLLEY